MSEPEILPPPHTDRIVRWRPEDYAEIQRVAREMGMSANFLIRTAVLGWLRARVTEAAGE